MARCKIYEIQGPDPGQTAGAIRCHRDADRKVAIDGREVPICKKHRGKAWHLFRAEGWPYAVDLDAEPPAKRKKKRT